MTVPVGTDVVVVGAGIHGLATARALARREVDVVLVEQFRLDHARGSSHGRSRIFRLAYPEPHWVRLAQEAFDAWRELEAETGVQVLELLGLLELIRPDDEGGSRAALQECGVPFEVLRREEVVERFPVAVPEGLSAIFQPQAGITRADLAREALWASAERHGARLVEGTKVRSLRDLDARAIVVTAGGWARGLLAPEAIELPVGVTRETVAYFRLDVARPIPSFVTLKPETRGHWIYGLHDPVHGLKMGIHMSGPSADPDEERGPEPALVDRIRAAAARYFPAADPEPAELDTCLYTITDDEEFVLERHGRIVVGSACSGHGFKFAPAVGERLADLAEEALAA